MRLSSRLCREDKRNFLTQNKKKVNVPVREQEPGESRLRV